MKSFFLMCRALKNLFKKEKVERELESELRAYVEMVTDEKVTAGASAQEARRAALADLGGIEQVKQAVRDHRAGTYMDRLPSSPPTLGVKSMLADKKLNSRVGSGLGQDIGRVSLISPASPR